ncbi:FAM10 family At4g22670-like [Olea europaea subsp. europaea]|uniref:FAM10 family At4g22670-like n=2 Tax=Olea europaea subsp. europaea TaxID=158383 RepID=A0A8S0RC83_OLEEU|nr:FAM10 family At4g22670-like [Olea europaea subsp. europaea]
MGDPSDDITDKDRKASQQSKIQAMEAISEDKLDEAIKHLTIAILLDPKSANIHATRASVYIKMKKPTAAIRDAIEALEINPDSGKGYKFHGMARAMFGQCEEGQEVAKDLHVTLKLDYDEEINVVDFDAHKFEEHHQRYERLRKEQEYSKIEHKRVQDRFKAQAAHLKAKKQEQSSSSGNQGGMPGGIWGFPGGMPGGFPGGVPGGFHDRGPGGFSSGMLGGFPRSVSGWIPGNIDYNKILKILNDPEMMVAFKDREVMAALQDVAMNPVSLTTHRANPKVAPVIAKIFGPSKLKVFNVNGRVNFESQNVITFVMLRETVRSYLFVQQMLYS